MVKHEKKTSQRFILQIIVILEAVALSAIAYLILICKNQTSEYEAVMGSYQAEVMKYEVLSRTAKRKSTPKKSKPQSTKYDKLMDGYSEAIREHKDQVLKQQLIDDSGTAEKQEMPSPISNEQKNPPLAQ